MAEIERADLTTLTVELLSAFVSNNTIESADLAGLIQSTHAALSGTNAPPQPEPVAPEFAPAVTVRKSLGSRDHILSLIDGKPYKTLKRHLSGHGLTPAEYRERYKLPANYPMVAPTYSEHRRDVAQRLGLGRKSVKTTEPDADAAAEPAAPAPDATAAVASPTRSSRKVATAPATAKQAKPKAATPDPEPPRAGVKRAGSAVTPAASVTDTAVPTDPVKPAPEPVAVTPKPAKTTPASKAKAPKAAARTATAAKAKRIASIDSQTEPKPAPAKRRRQKADKTPAPTE